MFGYTTPNQISHHSNLDVNIFSLRMTMTNLIALRVPRDPFRFLTPNFDQSVPNELGSFQLVKHSPQGELCICMKEIPNSELMVCWLPSNI